ncbi:MAG: aminoglycoside phosphotransferase family protein [Acidobacteriota bacterium]|nr:aminoglycoside phosphotransferase family protein [Acidobacteriota bacterium]
MNPARDLQAVIDIGLETHLISAEDLVAGQISFIDLSRRNHAHAIVAKHGQSYFIKRPTNNKMAQSVRNEALIYRLLNQLSPSGEGNALAPHFHTFHEDADALVLEYSPGVTPLSAYPNERRRPLQWVARSLGKMIARLHIITNHIPANMNALESISLYEPPVFYVLTPNVSMYCMLSPANLQLIKELQQNRQLQNQLDAAKHAWNPSCLVHGDLKWDNVLVYPARPGINSRGLRIADWELAGRGDPAWDVASILAGYISGWIQDEQLVSTKHPQRYKSTTNVSALCSLFLNAYLGERGLTAHEASETLRRAIAYCGMKLLWVAIEAMQESRLLSATYLTHVQVGINVLERPGEAMVHLFGMPCTAWPEAWLGESRVSRGRPNQVGAVATAYLDGTPTEV